MRTAETERCQEYKSGLCLETGFSPSDWGTRTSQINYKHCLEIDCCANSELSQYLGFYATLMHAILLNTEARIWTRLLWLQSTRLPFCYWSVKNRTCSSQPNRVGPFTKSSCGALSGLGSWQFGQEIRTWILISWRRFPPSNRGVRPMISHAGGFLFVQLISTCSLTRGHGSWTNRPILNSAQSNQLIGLLCPVFFLQ